MPPPPVVLEREGPFATLILNRPPLNILDLETLACLRDTLADLAGADDVVALFLRGAGERAFSAGVAVQDHTPDKVATMLERLHGAIRLLRRLPAVTVAAVQGHCLGGGMELAMACDLVLATRDARFGQPEIELGCFPPVAAALYPRRLGPGRTLDLLLSGRVLDCLEAERLGLVTRRAETSDLGRAIAMLRDELGARSAAVLRLIKRVVRAGTELPFGEALAESERVYLEELCATADISEGVAAFMAKRPPVWKHR